MLKNYLKITFRNIIRNKGFSIINITGLAFGLAVCILIILWVGDEYNYDRFNNKADNIHRIVFSYLSNGKNMQHWRTPPPMASTIKEKYPEVLDAVRFYNEGLVLAVNGEKKIKQQAGYTDQSIFNVFTLPFLFGSPEGALIDPSSIVISNEMSQIYFGDSDPVGEIITLDNHIELEITGVLEDLPANSHLQFDFLLPFSRMPEILGYGNEDDWGDFGFNTFLLLSDDQNINNIEEKINLCVNEIIPELDRKFFLQPLKNIHLYNLDGSPGTIKYVYIFTSIALFILIIACINFMNLSTARSTKRAKEIGLRKVVGAERKQISSQFLFESFL